MTPAVRWVRIYGVRCDDCGYSVRYDDTRVHGNFANGPPLICRCGGQLLYDVGGLP